MSGRISQAKGKHSSPYPDNQFIDKSSIKWNSLKMFLKDVPNLIYHILPVQCAVKFFPSS